MKYAFYSSLALRPVLVTLVVIAPLGIAYYFWGFPLAPEDIPGGDSTPADDPEIPDVNILNTIQDTFERLFRYFSEHGAYYPALVGTVPGATYGIEHSTQIAAMAIILSACIQLGLADMPSIMGWIQHIALSYEEFTHTVSPQHFQFVESVFNEIVSKVVQIREIIGNNTTITQSSPENIEIFNRIKPLLESIIHNLLITRVCMERPFDIDNTLSNVYSMLLMLLPADMDSLTNQLVYMRGLSGA